MNKSNFKPGAFVNLIGENINDCSPKLFIKNSPDSRSRELNNLTTIYENKFEEVHDKLYYMTKLEELILQVRAMENLKEIKLSIVRDEYIYARSPFFRIGNSVNDLRITVGKTQDHGNNLSDLEDKEEFMRMVESKMKSKMKSEISITQNSLGLNEYVFN